MLCLAHCQARRLETKSSLPEEEMNLAMVPSRLRRMFLDIIGPDTRGLADEGVLDIVNFLEGRKYHLLFPHGKTYRNILLDWDSKTELYFRMFPNGDWKRVRVG